MAAEHVTRIGARIAELRDQQGLTQKQLADRIPGKSTDGNQVSKWERGIHRPGDDTLEHIANALNTSVFDLLGPGPEEESPNLEAIIGGGSRTPDLQTQIAELAAKIDVAIRNQAEDRKALNFIVRALVALDLVTVDDDVSLEDLPFGPALVGVRDQQAPQTDAKRPASRTASGRP